MRDGVVVKGVQFRNHRVMGDILDLDIERGDDLLGHSVLQLEYVGQLAVVAFGPDMIAGDSID